MIRIGRFVIGRIDIEAGEFTYGNRLALGEIFSDESRTEYQRLKAASRELYGYSCRLLPIGLRMRALKHVSAGVFAWIQKEQILLKYQPSADELAAGIKELTKRVGNLSTVKALAKAYHRDPDEILKWSYAKVFGILFTDLEEHKFDERLTKVINAKYSRYNKHRT